MLALTEDIDPEDLDIPGGWTDQEFAYAGVMAVFNNPAQMTPSVIPMLGVGEFRLVCANKAALLDQFSLYAKPWDSVLNKHDLVTRKASTGEYVIDIIPKTEGESRPQVRG